MPDTPSPETELHADPLLREAPLISGFKVLDPAVLYAKVGQGGMGAVYRGRHFKLDLDVAVKCLKPSLADDSPEFVQRFEREARLAASLAHQNVVRVMDVYQKHGLHYIVMEFVRGESARERVLRKGKLAEQEALAVLLGATAGLAEAHGRGIVHRDIKPDNVLVSVEGRVKLADLGLAKAQAAGDQSMSLASGVMGTPQYMAPEQWDTPAVGPSADVWALGATLYYLLVGEHAIEAPTLAAAMRRVQDHDFPSLRDACPGLREEVYAMFERCVAREPEQRFADARALEKVLRPLVEIGEDALADAESASNTARVGVVSPPPRQTLMKIRAVIESGVEIDPEAPTIPSPGNTMRVPPPGEEGAVVETEPVAKPSRSRFGWVSTVLMIAVIVLARGWYKGWFDTTPNMEDTADLFAARLIYKQALDLLPQPGKLDEAIAKLQEALRASDKLEEAKVQLGKALDKKAERLERDNLDGAYHASKEANYWQPKNQAIKKRYDVLLGRMRKRLSAGLVLTSPAGYDVQKSNYLVSSESKIELRGRITSKGFRKMSLRVPQKMSVSRTPLGTLRPVTVIDGEFQTVVTLPEGDSQIWFVLQDDIGVDVGMQRTVRVTGTVGNRFSRPSNPKTCPQYEIFNEAGCHMLPIDVDTFRMGSIPRLLGRAPDEELHDVDLVRPFWLADTEVTRDQWQRVMNTAPWPDDIKGLTGDLPATHISSAMAIEFCNRLTALERAAKRLAPNFLYVLPTEAQWEYACMGGESGIFGKGIDYSNLAEFAVYKDSREAARPNLVRSRKPNAFGLFDMHGNVAEWCRDLAMPDGPNAYVKTKTYVQGVIEPVSMAGTMRVHRGGSFASHNGGVRAANRSIGALNQKSPQIGFRPALVRTQ